MVRVALMVGAVGDYEEAVGVREVKVIQEVAGRSLGRLSRTFLTPWRLQV